MSSPMVFELPASGPVPLPHHAEDEAREQSPSKKRSADVLENLTPRQKKARTDALERERRRYEKLKADPLCHVSPTCGQSVQCDRCGARIKLSDKNNYDAQHWTKHRGVCKKWSDADAAARRAMSSLGRRKTSCTPELTVDGASEGTSLSVKSEPASSRAPSPSPSTTPWLDQRRHFETQPLDAPATCAGYMAIAHPDIATVPACTSYPDLLEQMQAWTPARLRQPVCFGAPEVDPMKLALRTPAQWHGDWSHEPESDYDSDGDDMQIDPALV
ncbi:uncharacterized protein TRAVEDRAFT_47694 [Trametes versicolor FP-101664 SS1]|uniref:uncharacterized protein n=1 Tax=Trametes versicolor (strain FP-101664) TaxID=717944 RepID=UPI0004621B01|nr:uncharacterized protein TRAVEDRAFT_47694 [Trametes versicolor FP-101664 SS1]EIW58550.1 hypothetical protein TRAVEDRAFT_47694 [Trametes versicolor FP-101664 SS1]